MSASNSDFHGVAPTPSARRIPPLVPWYAAHSMAGFMSPLIINAAYFFSTYELHQPAQVQLAMAAGGGAIYTLSAIFGGRWVDRIGPRRMATFMTLACIPIALLGAAAAFYRSLWALVLLILLLNLTTGALWPSIESALTRCPGKLRLTSRITLYNISWSSTSFVASCVVGSMALGLTWPGVFITAAVLSAAACLIITFFSIPQAQMPPGHIEDSPQEQLRTKAILASPRSHTLLHMAWMSNMLSYVAANTVLPIMPTITVLLGIKSYAVATAIGSIWALARIAGFLLTTFWTGWHYRLSWMMIAFGALLVGTVSLLLSPSIVILVLSQILFGLAVALLYSGSLYYAMHLGSGSGANAGIHEALIGVGTVVGPGLAAVIGPPDAVEPKALAIFLILGLGGGAMAFMARRLRGLAAMSLQMERNAHV